MLLVDDVAVSYAISWWWGDDGAVSYAISW